MKYKSFHCKPMPDPVFVQGDYAVYELEHLGRWYLIKDGKELSWKNYTTSNPDYSKWIAGWEKNAAEQLDSLQARVDALLDERDEIINLITGVQSDARI